MLLLVYFYPVDGVTACFFRPIIIDGHIDDNINNMISMRDAQTDILISANSIRFVRN